MAREQFSYPESAELLRLLDEAARRGGVSRGQAFDDFLEMSVCSLSGGRMENRYLAVVKPYISGAKGKRGVDSLAELYGSAIAAMEGTRDNIKDVLGDLFVGAISYGENAQYFSPMPICQVMARLTIGDLSEEEKTMKKAVCDPACGSGRMLLAVAEIQRHWEFVGQDVDPRCCRLTALNLALRNLYGYAICGNSLKNEIRQVYRTGFNGVGFLREASAAEVRKRFGAELGVQYDEPIAANMDTQANNDAVPPDATSTADDSSQTPRKQLRLF